MSSFSVATVMLECTCISSPSSRAAGFFSKRVSSIWLRFSFEVSRCGRLSSGWLPGFLGTTQHKPNLNGRRARLLARARVQIFCLNAGSNNSGRLAEPLGHLPAYM
jgi:hypothetical protein